MTKKDYEKIAAVLRGFVTPGVDIATQYCPVDILAENIAAVFAADNDRFNRGRFLAACGIDGADMPADIVHMTLAD